MVKRDVLGRAECLTVTLSSRDGDGQSRSVSSKMDFLHARPLANTLTAPYPVLQVLAITDSSVEVSPRRAN